MNPKETVINCMKAWSEHNMENLLAVIAPDYVSESPMSGRIVGKDKMEWGFKLLDKSFPDLKEEIVSIIVEGNTVACEVIETATFTGPLEMPTGVIAPTNNSYKLPFSAFFRINSEGLITEQQNYWDTATWFRQLGIDPKAFAKK